MISFKEFLQEKQSGKLFCEIIYKVKFTLAFVSFNTDNEINERKINISGF